MAAAECQPAEQLTLVDENQNVIKAAPLPVSESPQFNPADPKYKAFRCLCHVTKLTWIGGLVSILPCIILALANVVVYAVFGGPYRGLFWTFAFIISYAVAVSILLFYSLRSENHCHVLPHAIYALWSVFVCLILGAFSLVVCLTGGTIMVGFAWKFLFTVFPELKLIPFMHKIVMLILKYSQTTVGTTIKAALAAAMAKVTIGAAFVAAFCGVGVIYNLLFFYVDVKCFRYFKDKRAHLKMQRSAARGLVMMQPLEVKPVIPISQKEPEHVIPENEIQDLPTHGKTVLIMDSPEHDQVNKTSVPDLVSQTNVSSVSPTVCV